MTQGDDVLDDHPSLPATAHAYYHQQLALRLKKLRYAYLLLCCLGLFGGHQWYLNDRRKAWMYCWLTIVPIGFVAIALLYQEISLTKYGLPSFFIQCVCLLGLLLELAAAVCVFVLPICLIADLLKLPAQMARRNLTIQKELAIEAQNKTESHLSGT